MRLKKERIKRSKKLGNLTVIADKVNIVSPNGKVGGLKMGAGVQAPRRQYQFSYNLDQGIGGPSVTSPSDSVPPPEGPPPQEPANPVGNALGRIGTMLGQAAWAYAGQSLFNRAAEDVSNWMFNSQTDPNVAQITELSPTLTNSSWPGIEPVPSPQGALPSPADSGYSSNGSWPGIEPVPTPDGLTGFPNDIQYVSYPSPAGSPGRPIPLEDSTRVLPARPPMIEVPSVRDANGRLVPRQGLSSPARRAMEAAEERRRALPPPIDTSLTNSPTDVFYSAMSGTQTPSNFYTPQGDAWTPPFQQFQPQPGVWAGNVSPNQQVPPFLSPTTSGGTSASTASGRGLGRAFPPPAINTSGMNPRTGMNLLQRTSPSALAGRSPPSTPQINLAASPEAVAAETSALSVNTQGMAPRTGMNLLEAGGRERMVAPVVYNPPSPQRPLGWEDARTYRSRQDRALGFGHLDYEQYATGDEEANEVVLNFAKADENLRRRVEAAVRGNPQERATRLERLRQQNPTLFLRPEIFRDPGVFVGEPGSPITPSTATTSSTIASPLERRYSRTTFRPITAEELNTWAYSSLPAQTTPMRGVRPPPISTANLPSRANYPNQRQFPGDEWIPTRRSGRRQREASPSGRRTRRRV